MKAFFLPLATALFSLSFTSARGQGDQGERTPAEQLLEITHFEKNGLEAAMAAFKPIIDQFRKQGLPPQGITEIETAASAYFHRVMTDPDLRKGVLGLYNETFTEEEIKELLAFYGTATGQKALVQMPQIMGRAMTLGQKHAEKYAPAFQKQLEKILAEHKDGGDAPVPPKEDDQ